MSRNGIQRAATIVGRPFAFCSVCLTANRERHILSPAQTVRNFQRTHRGLISKMRGNDMYGNRGNAIGEPNGIWPRVQAGASRFICVAEVEDTPGVRRQCGTKFETGCCTATHALRPQPFVQKVAEGGHLPKVVRTARPFWFTTARTPAAQHTS